MTKKTKKNITLPVSGVTVWRSEIEKNMIIGYMNSPHNWIFYSDIYGIQLGGVYCIGKILTK